MSQPESNRKSATVWVLIGVLIAGIPGFIMGVIFGNLEGYHNRFIRESLVAKKIIEQRPEFNGIYLEHSSQGELSFAGRVPTPESFKVLEAMVTEQFGRMDLEGR